MTAANADVPPNDVRALLRRLACLWVILCGSVLATPAAAATFIVNSSGDELGAFVGSGRCETAPGNGVCTLRRAMREADLLFADAQVGEPRPLVTIILHVPGNVIALDPARAFAPLRVYGNGDLTILGHGLDTTYILAPSNYAEVFELSAFGTVRMSGLTLAGGQRLVSGQGRLRLDYVRVAYALEGLYWFGGEADLTGCIFDHNGGPGQGGAVTIDSGFRSPESVTLRVRRSWLANNQGTNGPAVRAESGTVQLTDVILTANEASGSGGAAYVSDAAALRATNTTFSGNTAAQSAGALLVLGGDAVLRQSTITANRADADRDGVGQGGAIAVGFGLLTNLYGRVALDGAIVADNYVTAQVGGVFTAVAGNCAGTIATTSPTLFTLVDCGVTGVVPIVAPAALGPLQDNGGPTWSHAPLPGSPAIDAGGATPCGGADGVVTDQRGRWRRDGACDLGAIEVGASTPVKAMSHDLDGDGRADVVWRHQPGGDNAAWLMNGSVATGAGFLPRVGDLNWEIIASDDFDGDGYADLLWRHAVDGRLVYWRMNGLATREAVWLPAQEESSYRFAGTGDFDGNGRADLLWDLGDGSAMLWLLDGDAIRAVHFLSHIPGWFVVAVGAGDGTARASVVWRNFVTGEVTVWMMNGATRVSSQDLPLVSGRGWALAGYGDLDGDGRFDLFWRNVSANGPAAGLTAVWLLAAGGVRDAAFLPQVDPAVWNVVGVADTDGDGRSDVLWRAKDGQNARWRMNGTAAEASDYLVTVNDPGWQVR